MTTPDDAAAERTPDERRGDHAEIGRLADELVPALIAKLGASGLGELEVREGAWRVRLRMPADGRGPRRTAPARATGRAEARLDLSAGAAAPAAAGRPAPDPAVELTAGAQAVAVGPGDPAAPADPAPSDPAPNDPAPPIRAIATSPAVGFFRPRPDLAAGLRVRAGDRIGTIDVLGVAQELVSPADGLVGATLVEAGEPVEYGQEVVEIQLLGDPVVERAGVG